ncbi:hypothetical protein AAY473_016744 [Plecturocebus cupreus]
MSNSCQPLAFGKAHTQPHDVCKFSGGLSKYWENQEPAGVCKPFLCSSVPLHRLARVIRNQPHFATPGSTFQVQSLGFEAFSSISVHSARNDVGQGGTEAALHQQFQQTQDLNPGCTKHPSCATSSFSSFFLRNWYCELHCRNLLQKLGQATYFTVPHVKNRDNTSTYLTVTRHSASQVRWLMPAIPTLWEAKAATWEAEAGESLEPGRWRLQWAKMAPLHSSLGDKSKTLSQKKTKTKTKKKPLNKCGPFSRFG